MKAIEWQRQLRAFSTEHGKAIFSATELANLSGSSPRVLNVELARLQKQGIIVRYARGCYGLPEGVVPEDLLPLLDTGAYITGLAALYRHNLVTQSPAEITCFTDRRHNRSRVRNTPVGRFVFVCVGDRIYQPPQGLLAGPEQALCDFCWLCLRRGVDPQSLVTFRGIGNTASLPGVASRYPSTVQAVAGRIANDAISPRPSGTLG